MTAPSSGRKALFRGFSGITAAGRGYNILEVSGMNEPTVKEKKRATAKRRCLDYLCFVLGSALYAFGFRFFFEPNYISPGGLTGIAAIVNFLFSLPTGLILFLLNIPVLLLGYFKIGGKFIFKTLLVTVFVSFFIDLFTAVLPVFHGERLLAAIFGGAVSGLGLAVVMLRGATTGGVDVIAKVLRLKFPYFSMGRLVLMLDGLVVALAAVCYRDIETALYTAVALFVSSKVMDAILYGADKGRLLMIVTSRGGEMADALFRSVRRGVTVVPVLGGYHRQPREMLVCALRQPEVSRAINTVRKTDPDAFTVVTVTGGILGQGFEQRDV